MLLVACPNFWYNKQCKCMGQFCLASSPG